MTSFSQIEVAGGGALHQNREQKTGDRPEQAAHAGEAGLCHLLCPDLPGATPASARHGGDLMRPLVFG